MKKPTVIELPAPILGIALLLPLIMGPGSALAQTSGKTSEPISGQMSGMGTAHAEKARSTSLTVTVAGKTQTFSPADLAAMPHETVSVMNAHAKKTESYSGIPLAAILDKMGLPFAK